MGLKTTGQTVVDPLDIPHRLDELRALRDGWLDGEGTAPASAGLDWLASAFSDHYPAALPPPRLYPRPEGGVQAEWSIAGREISMEIDLNAHQAQWHVLLVADVSDATRQLDLSRPADWRWIADEIGDQSQGNS